MSHPTGYDFYRGAERAEEKLVAAAEKHGWTLAFDACMVQGVVITWSRPRPPHDTGYGPMLNAVGDQQFVTHEHHYTPEVEASDDRAAITWERACNRVRWGIEQIAADEVRPPKPLRSAVMVHIPPGANPEAIREAAEKAAGVWLDAGATRDGSTRG